MLNEFFKEKNLLVLPASFPNESDSYYGGVFVKDQLNEMKKHFKNIYVICPIVFTFGFTQEDKTCHDYVFDNIHVYFPRIYHFPIDYFRKTQPLNYLNAIKKIINNNHLHFDIIHAHFTWLSGYTGYLLKKEIHIPLIITVHEDNKWLQEEIRTGKEEFINTWKNADVLIRVNNKDLNLLKKFNDNVLHIPNGFNDEKFKKMDKLRCRKELNFSNDKKIILTIGNLIKQKNHIILIEAISDILKKRKDIITIIAGKGPLKSKLEKKINDSNLNEHIFLIGEQPHEKISHLLNTADTFVLPSLSESFGIVQIESMACGIPVVATINGGSEEIITSEDIGFLVENPLNSHTLAEKIDESLKKEWKTDVIIQESAKYSWKIIIKDILEIYKGVLDDSNKKRRI